MKKNYYEIILFCCLLLIETIFHLLMFGRFSFLGSLRVTCLTLFLTSIFSLLFHKCKDKIKRVIYLIIVCLFSIYALVEMQFSNFIGHFYSFNAVSDGLAGVSVFIPIFVRTMKIEYWFILLPILLFIVFAFIKKGYTMHVPFASKLVIVITTLLLYLLSFIGESVAFKEALKNHDSYDITIEKLGINAFFFEDIFTSIFTENKKDVKEDLIIEEVEVTPLPSLSEKPKEETIEVVEEEEVSYERIFDDTRLKEVAQSESNETFKQIDEYILSRPIEEKNEKTGIYKDYNFVYFMVESFDYIAIDKTSTPTLYKMYVEGDSFINHYTPIYVCGTGDSEWVGMTGTFPTMNECVAYNRNVLSTQSLAGLFANEGYKTYSFHNWDDQFYPRTVVELNYGFDAYYDQNDLKCKLVDGWLSDRELVEKALPYFINDDKFFAFIITSTMHFPYDGYSYYGDLYLDEINAVHPEYPLTIKRYLSKSMEFDKSLALLVEELEITGKLDKTVISIYGDHHPKTIDSQTLINCCETLQKEGPYAVDKLPFIIYCPSANGQLHDDYCCNTDQLPTIANMFDLNYDPRLYCGSDIFSKNSVAIFGNGDWISLKGHYHASSDSFEAFVDDVDESYYVNKNADIKNMRKINQAMINHDYYRHNSFVINPKVIEEKK